MTRPIDKYKDDPEFLKWLRKSRREYQSDALKHVVDAALRYHDETLRDDPAHMARLSKMKYALIDAIKGYNESKIPLEEETEVSLRIDLRTYEMLVKGE